MIESDIDEKLVLTVQTRQHALKAASLLVSEVPATLIDGDVPDVVLNYARRFEVYLQTGRIQ